MIAPKTPQVVTQGGGYSNSYSSYDDDEIETNPVGVALSVIIVFGIIACSACWRCYRKYYHDHDDQAGQVIVQPGITSTALSRPSPSRQGDSSNYQRPPKSPNITGYPPNTGYPPSPSPHTGYPSNTGYPPSPHTGYPSNYTGYPPSPHTGYPSNYTGYPSYNQYSAMQSPAASRTENPGVGFKNPPPYSAEKPQDYAASPYIHQPPVYSYVDPSSAEESTGAISSPFPTGATPSAPSSPFHSDGSQAD